MAAVLSWDDSPKCKAWSPELLSSVNKYLQQLEQGAPDKFIADYTGLLPDDKLKFWSEIIIAMIKFESNFDPHCIYHEPPPLGIDSVGLLQLSYEDQDNYGLEKIERSNKSLEDPLVNIRCGLTIFSHWVAKDNTVASGAGKQSRGAARYWSVMRSGHHVDEIQARVKQSMGL